MKAIDCTVNHDKGLGIDTWFSKEKTKPLLYFSVALWAACLKSISINDFEITPRLNPNFITGSHICWVSFNYISLEKENQSCLSTVIYPTEMSTKSQTNAKLVFDKLSVKTMFTLRDVKKKNPLKIYLVRWGALLLTLVSCLWGWNTRTAPRRISSHLISLYCIRWLLCLVEPPGGPTTIFHSPWRG